MVAPNLAGLVPGPEHPAKAWDLLQAAMQAQRAPGVALKEAAPAAKPCVARMPAQTVVTAAAEVKRQSKVAHRAPTLTSQPTRAEGKDADKPATRAEGKDGADDKDADAGTKRAEETKAGGTSAEGKSTGEAGKDATGGSAGSLTGEKRTQVQKAFGSHRSDAKVDIDINVSVGVVVPRHVHLVAIPEDIVVIVPGWRRYRYIVVGDTICIVDPDTYKIVEVIVLT